MKRRHDSNGDSEMNKRHKLDDSSEDDADEETDEDVVVRRNLELEQIYKSTVLSPEENSLCAMVSAL